MIIIQKPCSKSFFENESFFCLNDLFFLRISKNIYMISYGTQELSDFYLGLADASSTVDVLKVSWELIAVSGMNQFILTNCSVCIVNHSIFCMLF